MRLNYLLTFRLKSPTEQELNIKNFTFGLKFILRDRIREG